MIFRVKTLINKIISDFVFDSATTMGFNVDVQRDKNKEFLKSIEA